MFTDNVILGALLIFLIRVLSIGIATLRILIMGRSNKMVVFALAIVEALSFAITFGQVAADLDNIWNLAAYSIGFATGTWVGMLIEDKVAGGFATVNIVSMGNSLHIAESLRAAGFGATRTAGEGSTGSVGLVWVVARRSDSPKIVTIANEVDPKAFVTINETRSVSRGFLRYGRS